MFPSRLHRFAATALGSLCLCVQTFATWSIVVVDTATGEICVASATCIPNFNLRVNLAILAEEAGAGASQALGAPTSTRVLINDLLLLGVPPEEILAQIESSDNLYHMRQFGIVDLAGRAATHSGSNNLDWAGGVTGRQGTMVYAIQGNILTGAPVIQATEAALLQTQGDLAQRVMAAMEAARSMGGDGRCSCDPVHATSCGSPPTSFTKSAHTGFIIIGRPGDQPYCHALGCGVGSLYLGINTANLGELDPDPVLELRTKFNNWRADLIGRPDALLSTVHAYTEEVDAGSLTPISYVLDLADVDGTPVATGGATVTLQHDPTSAGLATLQQFTDHGDGTYTVEILPGSGSGLDRLRFVVDDGIRPVTLWPPTSLLHREVPQAPLLPGETIQGLQGLADLRSAFPMEDGLRAWAMAQGSAGMQLQRFLRASAGTPFALDREVAIANFAAWRITDFWLSDDELRMTFSAKMADGIERLFSTSRLDLASEFDEPIQLVDLESGFGEGGPWLSSDELEIWFHSLRDGQADIWHARRLNAQARWYPPEKCAEFSTAGHERYPMTSANETRLWFSRRQAGQSLLQHSARRPDGRFQPSETAAGSFADFASDAVALGVERTAQGEAIWRMGADNSGQRHLLRSRGAADSLSVTPDQVSVSSGGQFAFQLDAGPEWADCAYTMLVGLPGPGGILDGVGTLPIRQTLGLTDTLRSYYSQPELSGGNGDLDPVGSTSVLWLIPTAAALPPSLLGRDLAICFVARQASGHFVSEAVTVRLQP